MKTLILIFVLLMSSHYAFAQNNIITVPVAEIVPKGKLYVQPGIVANSDIVQLANIVTWGLGSNFQAGVNLIDLTMNTGSEEKIFPFDKFRPSKNPDLLLNLQKGFKLDDKSWLSIGTQSGVNISEESSKLSMFNYINVQRKINGKYLLLLGLYHGNDARLATDTDRGGILAGFKIPLTKKLTWASDYISGDNARSFINTGLGLKLTDEWSTYAGAVIPAPESNNKAGATIQFRYLTK